ncbi:MAG: hypothetical protein N4A40_09255 [Tissierellales bacterium]|jgi:hypothetical protein|nr:hypothetical protein [Tissierellales bacterium]
MKDSSKKNVIIAILALVCILSIGSLVFANMPNNNPSDENTPSTEDNLKENDEKYDDVTLADLPAIIEKELEKAAKEVEPEMKEMQKTVATEIDKAMSDIDPDLIKDSINEAFGSIDVDDYEFDDTKDPENGKKFKLEKIDLSDGSVVATINSHNAIKKFTLKTLSMDKWKYTDSTYENYNIDTPIFELRFSQTETPQELNKNQDLSKYYTNQVITIYKDSNTVKINMNDMITNYFQLPDDALSKIIELKNSEK